MNPLTAVDAIGESVVTPPGVSSRSGSQPPASAERSVQPRYRSLISTGRPPSHDGPLPPS